MGTKQSRRVVVKIIFRGNIKSDDISIEVSENTEQAINEVKKHLKTFGFDKPYQLYLNGDFAGGELNRFENRRIAEGDVFNVLRMMSGG